MPDISSVRSRVAGPSRSAAPLRPPPPREATAESRPAGSTRALARRGRQPFEMAFEACIVDFGELALFERNRPGLDLQPQRLQFQRVLASALLQCTQRVTDGFARILVFAR